jgi:secreted trypsin-like serine protease
LCNCFETSSNLGFIVQTQEGPAFQQGDKMKKNIMKNLLLAVTAAGVFASCAPSKSTRSIASENTDNNIIGGTVSSAEYQKQNGIVGLMMIFTDASGQQSGALCTGSLIHPNVVLTAAHCLVLPAKSKLVAAIVFFQPDLDAVMTEVQSGDRTHIRSMTKVIRNENYMKGTGSNNDVGLIRFDGVVPDGFQLANLPTPDLSSQLRQGTLLTLSGFGVSKYELTKDANGKLSKPVGSGDGVLRQVSGIKLLALSQDQNELQLDQSSGSGACHGDSGGPAYLVNPTNKKVYLVGVTSRGEEPCNKDAIYSSVIGYSNWIDTNSQKIMQ